MSPPWLKTLQGLPPHSRINELSPLPLISSPAVPASSLFLTSQTHSDPGPLHWLAYCTLPTTTPNAPYPQGSLPYLQGFCLSVTFSMRTSLVSLPPTEILFCSVRCIAETRDKYLVIE